MLEIVRYVLSAYNSFEIAARCRMPYDAKCDAIVGVFSGCTVVDNKSESPTSSCSVTACFSSSGIKNSAVICGTFGQHRAMFLETHLKSVRSTLVVIRTLVFDVINNVMPPKGHVEFHRVPCMLVSLSLSEFALAIKKARAKPVDNKIDLIGEEDLAVAPLAAAYERHHVPPRFDICV